MGKVILLSLVNDLKRIVQSIERGSEANSSRFATEAKRWLKESKKIKNDSVAKLLKKTETTLKQEDDLKKAEDLLMYSVLLQNQAVKLE